MINRKNAVISYSPNGEAFSLPTADDYFKEFRKIRDIANKHRKAKKEIVVVMGLGFVGAVMAGVVADSVDKKNRKPKNLSSACSEPQCAHMAIIDCFGILDDKKIKNYFQLGCEVKGLDRGHVKRIKDQTKIKNELPRKK